MVGLDGSGKMQETHWIMSTQTLITAADFEKIADGLGPCELVRGEVVRLSPGGYEHNRAVSNAHGLLWSWARQSRQGRALTKETGLIVGRDPDTVRGADVVYYSYRRLPQGSAPRGFVATPPDLVVEIVSERQSWRQAVTKAGEYLNMGVDRVWLVDFKTQRIHVYRPDTEPVILNRGDILADETVLPGFRCQVDDLFET